MNKLSAVITVVTEEADAAKSSVNVTKYNEWYWGKSPENSERPWETVFLAWAFDKVGAPFPHVPYCSQVEKYAKIHSAWKTKEYKVGDIALIYGGNIGLIIDVCSDGIVTIEGNCNGKIAEVKRPFEIITGAYRPEYR